MKRTRLVLLAMGLIIGVTALVRSILVAQPTRPNIIFILTDDLDIEYPDGSWIDHFPRL
jgi:hypothetical protein